jgi:hypothetical protein
MRRYKDAPLPNGTKIVTAMRHTGRREALDTAGMSVGGMSCPALRFEHVSILARLSPQRNDQRDSTNMFVAGDVFAAMCTSVHRALCGEGK